MAATFKSPISDWRILNYPSVTVQATVTNTAGTDSSIAGSPYPKTQVVMNVSATLAAGATAQTPLRINLIDGTSGGTPIRSWSISAPANQSFAINESDLNLICFSGLATLEFSGTSLAATQQAVSMSGYTKSYGDN